MISKEIVKGPATFKEKVVLKPNRINYFFGGNGIGKTTLTKILNKPSNFKDCTINWKHESVDTVVYNQDFVERSFEQSDTIKGVVLMLKKISIKPIRN